MAWCETSHDLRATRRGSALRAFGSRQVARSAQGGGAEFRQGRGHLQPRNYCNRPELHCFDRGGGAGIGRAGNNQDAVRNAVDMVVLARPLVADHASGLPVLRTLSLCTCCRHYPGAAAGRILRSFTQPCQPSPKGRRVGLRIVLFEACSAFTRVTACTLAPSPIRDALSEGFSHFVTSIAAPVASGWSGCRVGLAPTGKRRLVTAHTRPGHWPPCLLD